MRESVLDSHRLYRAAKKEDTLIVSFSGEALGYSPAEAEAEAELQAVQSP